MGDRERPLRVAVIGCGWFSYNHLHAWREIPEVELVAVCDRDAGRARDAAEAHGVPMWYEDADTMLDTERLDFVDVATTPPSHRSLVEAVARRGLPVICQKPLAIALDDARAMVAACRDAGVPLMVHENFRWQPPMREARRLLDAGTVGQPFFGRISWRTARDVFAVQPYLAEETHLILADIGVHMLDLARFFFGEPRALVCQTLRVRPTIKGEDVATLLLEFDHASCILDFSYSSRAPEDLYPRPRGPLPAATAAHRGDRGDRRHRPALPAVGRAIRRDRRGTGRPDSPLPLVNPADRGGAGQRRGDPAPLGRVPTGRPRSRNERRGQPPHARACRRGLRLSRHGYGLPPHVRCQCPLAPTTC